MDNIRNAFALVALSTAFLLVGCSEPLLPVEIEFAAAVGNRPISCATPADDVSLTDLRFFIHDIALVAESGEEVTVQVPDDGTWQGAQVALLDFEDGQGACINGTAAINTSVHGVIRSAISIGDFRGVTFTLGVPADLNHADPMKASPPLNQLPMHWHWLSGYKFLRAGVSRGADGFWLHLGSSHCDGSIGAGIHCKSPNRVRVSIDNFNPLQQRITIDLHQLFNGVDLTDGIDSDCSSGPAELACTGPMRALGIPIETRSPPNSRRTTVFRGDPRR